jgi:hypothetical protein
MINEADYDRFLGGWLILSHDVPPPPWAVLLPEGSRFEIRKNEKGEYWFVPSSGVAAPLDAPRLLEVRPDMERRQGEFELGNRLTGALCADLGGAISLLYFTLNTVGRSRRVISLSHVHLDDRSATFKEHAGVEHDHGRMAVRTVKHGGSHGIDD